MPGPDFGRAGRAWAYRLGLHKSKLFVAMYRRLSDLQYRSSWDDEVIFRGHTFRIGEDRSLYPAVRRGWFEAAELEALLPRVDESATVWDVGANVGIYSVLLAHAAPRGHVVAFEPVPATRQRLIDNLSRNGITNITVEEVALSSADGTAYMSVSDRSHGCDHITHGQGGDLAVRTMPGDDYVMSSSLGDPAVIKVDIEGHEPEFLRGCSELLRRRRPILMLEVNPTTWHSADMRSSFGEALRKLFDLYGAAMWIQAASTSRVTSFDVTAEHDAASTLLFDPSLG